MEKEKNYPKYSVLMSVYYKENPQFLKLSIDSMVNQTVRPDEFVIVKDGPLTQELNEVINKFVLVFPKLFKIIENKTNLGLGLSLNKGIMECRNEFVARMDSDDYSIPTRCERELDCFKQDSSLGIVGSFEAEFINNIENVVSVHKVPESNSEIQKFMRRRCALLHPTVMYKKSEILRCGNYHSVYLYEDYDLFLRMTLEYNVKAYNIQENLYYIRTSPDFYKRRGGFKYANTVLKFKWHQHLNGYMSLNDFFVSGIGQAIVCVLPNSIRKIIYLKLLR